MTVYNSESKCCTLKRPSISLTWSCGRITLTELSCAERTSGGEAIGEVVIRMAYEHSAIPHSGGVPRRSRRFEFPGNIIEEKITSPVALRLIKEWAYLRHKEIVDSWMVAEGRSPKSLK